MRVRRGAAGTLFGALVLAGSIVATRASAVSHPTTGTTITVTTTADDNTVDGNCSLREAIRAANTDTAVDACSAGNGADTITLGSGTYDVTSGVLGTKSDVTIVGADAGATFVVDGTGGECSACSQLFLVSAGGRLAMSGVTVEHARTAFRVLGTLELSDSTLNSENEHCRSIFFDSAGAIQNEAVTRLQNVHIARTPNAIYNGNGATFVGNGLTMFGNGHCGAEVSIENLGGMTLTNATFDADIDDAEAFWSIQNVNPATLTIDHSRFLHNFGGVAGASVLWNDGIASITDSAFDHNAILPIYNARQLTLRRDRFSTNHAESDEPGAVDNAGTVGGVLITATTVDHNIGGIGGGITNRAASHATLVDDTITDNTALREPTSRLGLLPPGGGITNEGVMMVRNVTIARNRVVGFNASEYHAGGVVTLPNAYTALSNSLVSDNHSAAPVVAQDCFGAIHSLGYNFIADPTECFIGATTTGNVVGSSALLEPLDDYGGPTMTSLPQWNSLAVDSANPATPNNNDATTCTVFDQRGVTRPRDGNGDGVSRCDMGAVER